MWLLTLERDTQMKKIIAVLLSALLFVAVFAAPASALSNIPSSTSVSKGFAKNGADFFVNLKKADASLTFSAPSNSQFTIDYNTGKLTFKTGPSSFLPVEVTVSDGVESQAVKVTVNYEWYEYFVIIFAAGWFWIAAVNN